MPVEEGSALHRSRKIQTEEGDAHLHCDVCRRALPTPTRKTQCMGRGAMPSPFLAARTGEGDAHPNLHVDRRALPTPTRKPHCLWRRAPPSSHPPPEQPARRRAMPTPIVTCGAALPTPLVKHNARGGGLGPHPSTEHLNGGGRCPPPPDPARSTV